MFASFGYANAQLLEGKVSYKVTFDSDDPSMKSQLSMMGNSTMTVWFTEKFARTEMDMGGFSKNITIIDKNAKKGLTLIDVPMQGMKMAVPMDNTDESEESEDSETEIEATETFIDVAGYKCRKYIMTDEEGNETELYATEEITKQNGGRFDSKKINGFMLKMVMDQGMFKMVFEATEVAKKFKEKESEIFSLEIPEGYEEGTMEDLQNMRGGM